MMDVEDVDAEIGDMEPATAVATSGAVAAPPGAQPARPGVGPGDVLYVGLGNTAVCWYRCALPATFGGNDWVGMVGDPPQVRYLTGIVKGRTQMPALDAYKVVVIQQPQGHGWRKIMRKLQAKGIKVVYEVDDNLHAIRSMPDHDFRAYFSKERLKGYEMCMRQADAMIVSTPQLADAYQHRARRVFVCENGIDVGRYNLTRPPRPTINVGWAGATGHADALAKWLAPVMDVMEVRDDVCFVSVGQDFANAVAEHFPPGRAIAVPWTLVDNYPAAMTMFDVAIAPAGDNGFFKCKSDLRWVEASALGIPVIGHPDVYPHIEHGVTGFHARTPDQVRSLVGQLVEDPELRRVVGEQARAHVRATRDMRVMVDQWADVFRQLVEIQS